MTALRPPRRRKQRTTRVIWRRCRGGRDARCRRSAQPLATGATTGRDEDALLGETKDALGAMALVLGVAWDPRKGDGGALSRVEIKGLAETTRRWQNPAGRSASRGSICSSCACPLYGASPCPSIRLFENCC